jgi:hypothetical protein
MSSCLGWYVLSGTSHHLTHPSHLTFYTQDAIDAQIIARILEFREILKSIGKTITKRNHKQIDNDRFRTGLAKLKNKPERTISEEKQMFKVRCGRFFLSCHPYKCLSNRTFFFFAMT